LRLCFGELLVLSPACLKMRLERNCVRDEFKTQTTPPDVSNSLFQFWTLILKREEEVLVNITHLLEILLHFLNVGHDALICIGGYLIAISEEVRPIICCKVMHNLNCEEPEKVLQTHLVTWKQSFVENKSPLEAWGFSQRNTFPKSLQWIPVRLPHSSVWQWTWWWRSGNRCDHAFYIL
jgi:hypothetical protein